jgi:D-glycero-alpha-D-manno-heptose 1-phosphate guanylyltransferase
MGETSISNDSKETNLKECIILAGGLGTRLRETVPKLPKCLAPVAGKPFLFHIIKQLQKQGITHFVFSLGYKHEYIVSFLDTHFPEINRSLSIEDEPLGTGGAIKKALSYCLNKHVGVINGDTFFNVSFHAANAFHFERKAECTLVLKPMLRFDRYGVVTIDESNVVVEFKEKKYYESGFINGGVYIIDKDQFEKNILPEKFSFEKDYLEKEVGTSKLTGFVQDEYFIDIGIPEDFNKANLELSDYL